MRYAFLSLFTAMLMSTTLTMTASARDAAEDAEFAQRVAAGPAPQTMRINDITIEHYRLPEGDTAGHEFLVIRQGKETPLRLVDHRFTMRQLRAGGGGPNLIFRGSSSDGPCCVTAYVVWLEGGMRAESVKLGASDFDIAGSTSGGAPRLRFHDTAFAGWNATVAESPAPVVLLRMDIDAYVADSESMRRPAPDATALAALAEPIRRVYQDLPAGSLSPVLWGKMLDLIYAGNADAARRLLDLAWPEQRPGKADFLAAFTTRLHEGDVWKRFDLGKILGADAAFPPGVPL